jgi:hypothetical protein
MKSVTAPDLLGRKWPALHSSRIYPMEKREGVTIAKIIKGHIYIYATIDELLGGFVSIKSYSIKVKLSMCLTY